MSIERRILGRRKPGALIGPNAVLQTVAVMEERLGHAETAAILADAQITRLPSGENMIPEIEALRLHRWLAMHVPMGALVIAEEAGARTADYIIAHRIPRAAGWLLRHLPARAAAPLLMAAIGKHAWTFVGGGAFVAADAWHFTIDREAAGDTLPPPESLFLWYAAVFTRLYRVLVADDCTCRMIAPDMPCDLARSYAITRRRP
ncbi:MAG: bacteriochlorophyll 4-vinyl reductase [Erythrobacter sp.]|uniref:bacteriochlorophyll 4-vinyl reductase n=1 Tax=Erythrobacter sp. TaxID=1042 RepID=UPI0025CCECCE|nr:bacteriochlorophyll 4-vinyl reductase [Erythrobacter sp.]MCL9999316.1 bacteriochlorophyll 4-vinyl reductase [Erythrobacter sp.]